MRAQDTVLNGRYTLRQQVNMPGIAPSELWEAMDGNDEHYTLKITPYQGEKPPSEIRRMWDNDLRVMYRLSSSPGAEVRLVVMKDAGIDSDKHAMILVYEGCGYGTFADMLKGRKHSASTHWLSFKKLKNSSARQELWYALLRLAQGLKSLHDQKLIHRNVTPEAIWGQTEDGPESLRLSGFDWSARIGHAANFSERSPWATPPELEKVGYAFSSDWYGFGTTVARCFYDIEHLNQKNFTTLAEELNRVTLTQNPCNLGQIEKNFIKVVTATDQINRLQSPVTILDGITKIIESLSFGKVESGNAWRVLLYVDHKNANMIKVACDAGFMPDPNDSFKSFDPDSALHQEHLKRFIDHRTRNASLYWILDGRQFELQCDGLFIRGEKWLDRNREQSWKAAKAYLGLTRHRSDHISGRGFNNICIDIEFIHREVNRKISGSGFLAWDKFIPQERSNSELDKDSQHLQQFLHISNQMEILLRDAELFKYKIIHVQDKENPEEIIITATEEDRPSRNFFNANKTLVDYLQQERDAGKKFSDYVFLTDSDSMFIRRDDAFKGKQDDWVEKSQWRIRDIDQENETVTLFRQNHEGIASPPQKGYLRTRGHYGQIRLIQRRKQAIDRLFSHAFLLRALATPKFTHIDAGESALPWPQIEGDAVIDKNKLAIIKDILRTRPLYALQGPPGTGKSTLVAHLLRQILEDDPMAQILVTSKDHEAVDVLLDKIEKQAYCDLAPEELPLTIRLNRRDGKDGATEEANKICKIAYSAIEKSMTDTKDISTFGEIQRKWHEFLEKHIDYQNDSDQDNNISTSKRALSDLVRRGASITYCTTSSGDLEELAKGMRSFDWSIVEEAGKTHGFDLALPLQAGHRWLLLGDHKQLRPFLYDEFSACLDQLQGNDKNKGAIEILDELSKNGNSNLVDVTWIKEKIKNGEEKEDENWINGFQNYARNWLGSFANIFEQYRSIKDLTLEESIGASAGSLTTQYRMPLVLGQLNSTVFYDDMVRSATDDAQKTSDTDHSNPLIAPSWLTEKSLVWLDIPWAPDNKETKGTGYSNKREQRVIADLLRQMELNPETKDLHTLAILTPYNMQKNAINSDINIKAPDGCKFGSAQRLNKAEMNRNEKAFSIDSFQGDEADIIIASLVRNKPIGAKESDAPRPSDIRFIAQADRLNVMLSRPRCLLIIVGCWEYLSACVSDVLTKDDQGNYINPDFGPFKQLIKELTVMFEDGRALKISADEVLS